MTKETVARIIAIANQKGGVGKTTTTISLGAALADMGRRVLLVDLDGQQSLCSALKIPKPKPGLADVLFSKVFFDRAELSEILVDAWKMTVAGGYGLANLDSPLSGYGSSSAALKEVLAPHLHLFDFVLLDCGPSIHFLTTSGLVAAEEVLVPVQTEFLALEMLPGIMATVQDIRTRLNPRLRVSGFVPTMYDRRTRHSLAVLETIAVQANRYRVPAFKPIPRTIRIAEAAATGRPFTQYDPNSPAAHAYRALATEIDMRSKLKDTIVAPTASMRTFEHSVGLHCHSPRTAALV